MNNCAVLKLWDNILHFISPNRTTFGFGEYLYIGKKSMAAWKNLDFNRGNTK